MGHYIAKKCLDTRIKKHLVKNISYLISNRKKRKAFQQKWFYKLNIGFKENAAKKAYLARYYQPLKTNYEIICRQANVVDLPIWQLWLQGHEQAPPLVRKCFESVEKYSGGRKIQRLTEKDLLNYIDLPGYIWDKYHKGLIPKAHFSDIVRSCLLKTHGGTWIDATVLLTDNIPGNILQQDFFAFETGSDRLFVMDNWFLHAQPEHVVLENMLAMLYDYWKNEQELVDYFFYQMLLSGMFQTNNFFVKLRQNFLHIVGGPMLELNRNFMEPFDAAKLELIKANASIHKLTYFSKYQRKNHKGTFLDAFQNSGAVQFF